MGTIVGNCCWELLLGTFVGNYCWELLLGTIVGNYCHPTPSLSPSLSHLCLPLRLFLLTFSTLHLSLSPDFTNMSPSLPLPALYLPLFLFFYSSLSSLSLSPPSFNLLLSLFCPLIFSPLSTSLFHISFSLSQLSFSLSLITPLSICSLPHLFSIFLDLFPFLSPLSFSTFPKLPLFSTFHAFAL